MSKVLIVEDEADLAGQIRQWLTREHYTVEIADNGQSAMELLRVYQYDVVILDWMLPGMSGIEVCKQFRSRGGKTPVIMLTAKSSVDEKEEGLDSGADDYLAKPFHLKELAARVRALIRRGSQAKTNVLTHGNIELDPIARKVTRDGKDVHLEPKEFNLLEFFMRNPNQVFSAEALITRVWESDTLVSNDAIRTYIKGLRKKLDDSSIISTVHGVGYKMDSN
ncbi:MAG TPA: response regulator transcription factor [Candidatus Obscuribacterales bacterium]